MTIKIALPTGDPREAVNDLFANLGVPAPGYEPSSRLLRSTDESAGVTVRVFREKDIPVQVALGNYHIGICGEVWLAEQQVRFPLQRVVQIGSVPGPTTEVWVAAAPASGVAPDRIPAPAALFGARIASELPNLADLFAVHARIPGYRLMPLHGSSDAYPPEDAEIVLAVGTRDSVERKGLVPLHRLFAGGLALIANADALARRDLTAVLGRLATIVGPPGGGIQLPPKGEGGFVAHPERSYDIVRMAVPDGHAQRGTFARLAESGIAFAGYEEKTFVRRPTSDIAGLEVKVIRPQDMPSMVALGLFDIAITGRDLLQEHLCRFPSSPVEMVVDLKHSRYRIGPVVDEKFPAETTADALAIWRSLGRPVRIASEFPALAEQFARDTHLLHTEVVPIAGASEGFVPEDVDILIEGSETGTSIRVNKLKMLDPFMESTNCVIVRKEALTVRTDIVRELVSKLRAAADRVDS